jgi:hypothetical protein
MIDMIDYYFEASASRRMRLVGSISFRFTKDELTATSLKLPSSVEIEDIEIDLIDEVSDYPDDFEPPE